MGSRIGKYGKKGKPIPILGHNMPLAALGVFILWCGWYGFNSGSTTSVTPEIAGIAVNTTLAGAAGAIMAMITVWVKFKKPDVGMTLNGALACLVGITAGCTNISPLSSIIIGLVAGFIVVLAVLLVDRTKIDDLVGAISVHGVCGAWGTFVDGLFNTRGTSLKIIGVQLIGIRAAFAWNFTVSLIMFKIINMAIGLMVSPKKELEGLDFCEHGADAYPDFQITTIKT